MFVFLMPRMKLYGAFIFSDFELIIYFCFLFSLFFSENLLRGSVATDQDSRLSWNEPISTRSAVKFVGEETLSDDGEVDLPDVRNIRVLFFTMLLNSMYISSSTIKSYLTYLTHLTKCL